MTSQLDDLRRKLAEERQAAEARIDSLVVRVRVLSSLLRMLSDAATAFRMRDTSDIRKSYEAAVKLDDAIIRAREVARDPWQTMRDWMPRCNGAPCTCTAPVVGSPQHEQANHQNGE